MDVPRRTCGQRRWEKRAEAHECIEVYGGGPLCRKSSERFPEFAHHMVESCLQCPQTSPQGRFAQSSPNGTDTLSTAERDGVHVFRSEALAIPEDGEILSRLPACMRSKRGSGLVARLRCAWTARVRVSLVANGIHATMGGPNPGQRTPKPEPG